MIRYAFPVVCARGVCLAALVLVAWLAMPTGAPADTGLLELLARAERRYGEVEDYTAIFLRRELINGVLRPRETILLKFRRPFKVYLKWLDGPGKDREGLYVKGAYEDKFLVRDGRGLRGLVTAVLDPAHPRVLEESRHPITDTGIGRLLEIIGENVRRAEREGKLRLTDKGLGAVADRSVRQVEGILAGDSGSGYYCRRVLLSFDLENGLPIRIVVYDWADRVVEEYEYTQLRLNVGLADQDFDPDNRDYGFSPLRLSLPN